jgi:hypothetical protein
VTLSLSADIYTVKKALRDFPSPAGMSRTKTPWLGIMKSSFTV